MARTTQTARKTAAAKKTSGRRASARTSLTKEADVMEKAASNSKVLAKAQRGLVKKADSKKRKRYHFLSHTGDSVLENGYYPIEAVIGERDTSDSRKEFCVVWKGEWPESSRTAWVDSGDVVETDIADYRSRSARVAIAVDNADTNSEPNPDSTFTVSRTVRGSHDLAPNLQSHVPTLRVGLPYEDKSVHVALLPLKALAVLQAWSYQPFPELPLRLYPVTNTPPEIFEIYRLFLYTGVLFSHHAATEQDFADDGAEMHEDAEWSRLAQGYLLGLRLEDERFCNAVVDGIVEKMTEIDRYPTGIAAEVYAATPLGDPLRCLIVDLHVCKGLGTWIKTPHEDALGPEDFLQDVQAGMAAAGAALNEDDAPMPWEFDICQYHTHHATAKCERKIADPTSPSSSKSTTGHQGHRYPCPDAEQYNCRETYTTKQNATRHSRTVHHGISRNQPKSKSEITASRLASIEKSTPARTSTVVRVGKRFPCPDAEQYKCGATFSLEKDARRHSGRIHRREQVKLSNV